MLNARGVNTFTGGVDITQRGPAQRLPGGAGEQEYQRPRQRRGAMGPGIEQKSAREKRAHASDLVSGHAKRMGDLLPSHLRTPHNRGV